MIDRLVLFSFLYAIKNATIKIRSYSNKYPMLITLGYLGSDHKEWQLYIKNTKLFFIQKCDNKIKIDSEE